jgi:hypothetical protein
MEETYVLIFAFRDPQREIAIDIGNGENLVFGYTYADILYAFSFLIYYPAENSMIALGVDDK